MDVDISVWVQAVGGNKANVCYNNSNNNGNRPSCSCLSLVCGRFHCSDFEVIPQSSMRYVVCSRASVMKMTTLQSVLLVLHCPLVRMTCTQTHMSVPTSLIVINHSQWEGECYFKVV